MAYTPNPDREVKDGKAVVSAKELAAFKSQYGEDKSLRDLLNMDKGLRRKGDSAPASKAPSKADTDALEAKGQAGNKAMQDEEEKSSTGPDSASKNLGSAVGSRKVQPDFTLGKKPTPEQASANREAVADTVKNAASDIADYANKPFLSPMMRKAEENKGKTYRDMSGKVQTASEIKRGGVVKKMASGGMASSRGDGIAQRGKTRGKMC
jgi:hypothetical protein